MTPHDLTQARLHHQRIAAPPPATPAALVGALGAVQAQDYPAALWAVGLRVPGATEATIEQALTAGSILRTHVLRPTWHFVTPADLRWMLALSAPHLRRSHASRFRDLDLDAATLQQSATVIGATLAGGQHRTRPELVAALEQAGLGNENQRVTHMLFHAELEGLICNGVRRGKQITYALLDERAPATPPLDRAAALAELARRYFTAHGPATLADYVWWSGLPVGDARAGLAQVAAALHQETVDSQVYWMAPAPPPPPAPDAAYLLPNFDEYLVGYKDRAALIDPTHADTLGWAGNVLFQHTIVVGGRVVGTWKRTFGKGTVTVDATLFAPLAPADQQAVAATAAQYARFVGLPLVLRGVTEAGHAPGGA